MNQKVHSQIVLSLRGTSLGISHGTTPGAERLSRGSSASEALMWTRNLTAALAPIVEATDSTPGLLFRQGSPRKLQPTGAAMKNPPSVFPLLLGRFRPGSPSPPRTSSSGKEPYG